MTRKSSQKVLAEQIIKGVIDDIRWPDVLWHARDHQEAEELMKLIEEAKITIRWPR